MSCKCCCTHGHTAIQEKRNSLLKDYWRIILSALLLFGGLILNATDTTFFKGEYVPFIWYLLAYLPVGLPVMREAWESILQKDVFSEFTLMSIATLGAFYIGEYPEGVAVMLFYSLGELFQTKPSVTSAPCSTYVPKRQRSSETAVHLSKLPNVCR